MAAAKRIVVGLAAVALAVLATTHAVAAEVLVFGAASLKEALDEQARRFAASGGDKVTVSYAASSALVHLGVWQSVEHRVARAENVRAALALVSRGEAPFGIVYATDARADKGVRVVDTFPADSHPAIVYPAALVATSASPAAKPLLDYLQSAAARPVWERYGFRMAR